MRNPFAHTAISTIIALALGVGLIGCGTIVPPPPDNASGIPDTEPNDSFSTAQAIALPAGSAVSIEGTFEGDDDVDVFDLGTFAAGQTLSARLSGDQAVNPDNVQFGFFDPDQNVAILDNNAVTAADQNIAFTIRKPGTYYLALAELNPRVASSPRYTVQITAGTSAISVPPAQVIYLNYNGASRVTIGGVTFADVLPFSALDVGADPAAIAARVTERTRANYAPYNIEILSSYDTAEPAGPHGTVHISASANPDLYGLSSSVDWYNQDPTDNAIIFAGSLTGRGLSETQFIDALANIVTHEMGHMSGLAHTLDPAELMDQVTPLNALARPQTFHTAPLAEFPIGQGNTPELLQFALGLLQGP